MTKPTYQDADMMLKMAQLHSDAGIPELGAWIWSDEFITKHEEFVKEYPLGSEGFTKFSSFLFWYETLGTLYKHGLFNEELLLDWVMVGAVWERLENIILGLREQFESPRLYENFELMAKADKE